MKILKRDVEQDIFKLGKNSKMFYFTVFESGSAGDKMLKLC